MEADPWSSSSPWADDGSSSAAAASSTIAPSELEGTDSLPTFQISDSAAQPPGSTTSVDYASAAPWGASPVHAQFASAAAGARSGPKTPSTAGVEPPAWESDSSSAAAPSSSPPKTAAWTATSADDIPPSLTDSKPALNRAGASDDTDPWGSGAASAATLDAPASSAPASATGSSGSGWAPIASAGLRPAAGDGERTPTSAVPGLSSALSSGPSGWPATTAGEDRNPTPPASAGWSAGVGLGAAGVADSLDESPWGPPPGVASDLRPPERATQMLSPDALQAVIDRKLDPSKEKQALEISVPRASTDLKGSPEGGSTPRDPQSASAQQSTWLARLKASQKGSPDPTRLSLEADPAGRNSSERQKKAESSTAATGSKPGFVQSSKQAPSGAAGMISSLIASAKKNVAPPKVVSAADEDEEEDEEGPKTGKTTSTFASSNPDSANDLLSFDDASERRKEQSEKKPRPDGEQPGVISRWFGKWGGGGDPAAHVAAGVSAESYADRVEGKEGLSQADLDWLDQTAPAVHSPALPVSFAEDHDQASYSADAEDNRRVRGGPTQQQSLQVPAGRGRGAAVQRSTSGSSSTSSSSSPLDNWLEQGQKASGGAQYATSSRGAPVHLQQAPLASGIGPAAGSGPRGPSMTGTLMPNSGRSRAPGPATPSTGRMTSGGSADLFGEFQSETFSDWSPGPQSAAQQQQPTLPRQQQQQPVQGGIRNVSNGSSTLGVGLNENTSLRGLRTPASAVSSQFSPAATSDGFGSPTGALMPAERKPIGIVEQRNRMRGALDPFGDPFMSGRGTVDENFGRDYRDDDEEEQSFSALEAAGGPSYRDDPDPAPVAPRQRPAQVALPSQQQAHRRQASAPKAPYSDINDLIGGLAVDPKRAATPLVRPVAPSAKDDVDLLGSFVTAPVAPAQGAAHSKQPPLRAPGGPLLPPPGGQTRAGGLLPPPPPSSSRSAAVSSAKRLGAPGAQQTRASATAAHSAVTTGPSKGKGMTQDDLSFFENL